jgi:predicted nucleotidyltransferase
MICAMSVVELPIQIDREKIAEFCRMRGIRKLSLFGSVLRDDFDPARSDVDVLAEFRAGRAGRGWFSLFRLRRGIGRHYWPAGGFLFAPQPVH